MTSLSEVSRKAQTGPPSWAEPCPPVSIPTSLGPNCEPSNWRLPMRRFLGIWLLSLCTLLGISEMEADAGEARSPLLRFDMFLGFDNVVPDFGWFPVTFEVKNDGPPFVGTVEVGEGNFGGGASRSMTVELPTGTLKRFTIPMFKSELYQHEWQGRLKDAGGHLRAEASQLVRRRVPWNGLTIGALARTSAGAPSFPSYEGIETEAQPAVGRLLPELFPDNPVILESLRVLYLDSEKALTLTAPQVNALITWLYGGGHLVVNLEQLGDLAGLPWLRRILPAIPSGTATCRPAVALHHFSTQNWPEFPVQKNNKNQPSAPATHPSLLALGFGSGFANAEMTVWTLNPTGLQIDVASENTPLVVSAARGWGRISFLAFNSEREPFTSWEHRTWFWASLCGGKEWIRQGVGSFSYRSTDGVFGALIDSTQIRKLPVGWLLLLLLGYLLVIGPFDRWWLRKINREMLTWITFPCYVALFSGLIYVIGYRLRAGETEWNEIQMVDVIPFGDQSQWRVRSFGSTYSPSNRRYNFGSKLPFATFRPEAQLQGRGSREGDNGIIAQVGNSYKASVPVPVWTSRLFVQDAWTPHPLPLRVEVTGEGSHLKLKIDNQTGQRIEQGCLIHKGRMYEIENIATGNSEFTDTQITAGLELSDFIAALQPRITSAADNRRQAFGNNSTEDKPSPRDLTLFASLSGLTTASGKIESSRFIASPGIDLSHRVRQGDGLFFAWLPDHTAVPSFNEFEPRKSKRYTCYRLILPTEKSPPQNR